MRSRGLRLPDAKQLARRQLKQDTSAFTTLCFQLKAAGLVGFETEWRFAIGIEREWKWDIAYVEQRLAIEVDGGIWVKGAHGHPLTILRNMEKRNWGARLGWRLLSFSTDEAKNGSALNFIECVFNDVKVLTEREKYAQQQSNAKTFRSRTRRSVRKRVGGPNGK